MLLTFLYSCNIKLTYYSFTMLTSYHSSHFWRTLFTGWTCLIHDKQRFLLLNIFTVSELTCLLKFLLNSYMHSSLISLSPRIKLPLLARYTGFQTLDTILLNQIITPRYIIFVRNYLQSPLIWQYISRYPKLCRNYY